MNRYNTISFTFLPWKRTSLRIDSYQVEGISNLSINYRHIFAKYTQVLFHESSGLPPAHTFIRDKPEGTNLSNWITIVLVTSLVFKCQGKPHAEKVCVLGSNTEMTIQETLQNQPLSPENVSS